MLHVLAAALLYRADVLVSAGHEGRPASCSRYPKRACNLGAAGERELTPVLADAVTQRLRDGGFDVIRRPADFDGSYIVKVALFLHYDGSTTPCSSGASIGYHDPQFAAAAARWRTLYGAIAPFGFQPDNFTVGLRDYYGFRQVRASDAAFVFEMGELTCPAQRAWLETHVPEQADAIARFVTDLLATGS